MPNILLLGFLRTLYTTDFSHLFLFLSSQSPLQLLFFTSLQTGFPSGMSWSSSLDMYYQGNFIYPQNFSYHLKLRSFKYLFTNEHLFYANTRTFKGIPDNLVVSKLPQTACAKITISFNSHQICLSHVLPAGQPPSPSLRLSSVFPDSSHRHTQLVLEIQTLSHKSTFHLLNSLT